MCRIARITTRFDSIRGWLQNLENSFGGDGNGLAIQKKVMKGLKVSNHMIAEVIAQTQAPALYHTRHSSIGGRASCLCHPFRCADGWLVHNGHWGTGAGYAAMHQVEHGGHLRSDTSVMAAMVDGLGFAGAMERFWPIGVWLWQDDHSKLWVRKSGGELWYCPKLGAWGSEPAPEGVWYEVDDGDYKPGQVPREKPKPVVVAVKGLWPAEGRETGNRWAWQQTALPILEKIRGGW